MANESGTATATAPATAEPGKAAPASEAKPAAAAAAASAEKPATPAEGAPKVEKPAGEGEGTAAKPGAATEGKPKEGDKSGQADLKLPEGSLLDPKTVDEIKSLAKEKGWDSATAQAVLERQDKAVRSYVEAEQGKLTERTGQWIKEASEDKEIGGEKFAENSELAKRVVHKFFSKSFLDSLDKTKLGNYPEFVRGFVRIGRAMSEDRLVLPEPGSMGGKKSAEEALYGGSEKSDGKEK